jgi:hypothetical protein
VPPLDSREKHLPGMNFTGPGTNVTRRLEMGVKPVDELDKAALQHDFATEPRGPYTSKGKPHLLRKADRILMHRANHLIRTGYQPLWKAELVASAMLALLLTGARGRR